MNKQGFDLQVISYGTYIDDEDPEALFRVEVTTVRLNAVALHAWHDASYVNPPDCYETQAEWLEHRAKKQAKLSCWKGRVINAVGLAGNANGILVSQAHAEVFSVVRIYEMERR